MEYYNDLMEAIDGLKARGYDRDFNLTSDCLVCKKSNSKLYPDQFNVDAFYRFEGMSSTDDNSIIYAISLSDGTKASASAKAQFTNTLMLFLICIK